MNVFKIFSNFLVRSWSIVLIWSLLVLTPIWALAQSTSMTTSTPINQTSSDYVTHKSQFFNYDVYQDLANTYKNNSKSKLSSPTNISTPVPVTNNVTTIKSISDVKDTTSSSQQNFYKPVFELNKIYSNFYLGIGKMSDYVNDINYSNLILGIKNYKFLWLNALNTMGVYTGLDLGFDLGKRNADNKNSTGLHLSSSFNHETSSSQRPAFNPELYSKYNAYAFNTSLILITGLKFNVYKQLSLLGELGGGINYTLFTIPNSSFTKQVGASLKYGLVRVQGQAYLGVDYNSTIELGLKIAASNTGYSSIGLLISLTY